MLLSSATSRQRGWQPTIARGIRLTRQAFSILATHAHPEEWVLGLPRATHGGPVCCTWSPDSSLKGWLGSCSGGQTPEKEGQGPFILVTQRETASGERPQKECPGLGSPLNKFHTLLPLGFSQANSLWQTKWYLLSSPLL